jgi:methionine-gamma-lyase
MKNLENYDIATQCVHSGQLEDKFGAVVTPIYQVSTFKFRDADHGARLFKGEEDGFIYTRMRNPTVEAMEKSVAMLEGGSNAIGCASGMAAVHAVFAHMLRAGDHVVCSNGVYGPTSVILETLFSKFGVESTFVDSSDLEQTKAAMRPNTKMVYIETPGNPTLAVTDIKATADLAHENNAKLIVDNTFLSPIFQKPFELGADVILHSMTKYINGHADVVGGIIIVKDNDEYKAFRKTMNLIGGVIDPFNAFMVHRGIKTMKIRVEKAAENTIKIAEFLEKHPKVDRVWYPGLKSFPQYDLHHKQSKGDGSMIAMELKGGLPAGKALMDNIQIVQLAVSLGGVESLIQHPASMTHAAMSKENRKQAGITDGLVRISIGIEDCDELITAFDNALKFA